MYSKKLIILITYCFLYGCGNYSVGYQDGYEKRVMQRWIIFASADYTAGYQSGKAEKFQDEWFAENLNDMNLLQLHCPVANLRSDPLMFLPGEYKRVGLDTYQSAY